MTSNEYDIAIKKGETYREQFTIEDDSGNPTNLTGATITAKYELNNTKASFTTSVTSASGGVFELYLSAATTEALNASIKGKYDVFIAFASGDKFCVLEGNINIENAVTI